MELQILFEKVSSLLDAVAFDALWPGFVRSPFALYNESIAVLDSGVIPRDPRMMGNTAISWDNGFMAIWNSDGTEEPELLASNIIHEMFHAFQYTRGETRFPKDLNMLSYPENAENLSLKLEENRLLAECFELSPEQQKQNLAAVAALRRRRRELIGPYLDYELYAETAEGMAVYTEMSALRKISAAMYEAALKRSCARLSEGEFLFDPRRCSYDSGALFLLACKRNGLDFYHEVGQETRPVYSMIEERLPVIQAPLPREDVSCRALQFYRDKQERIDRFFSEASLCTEGEYEICGYDPMNMERRGDHVLCSHLIMLDQNGENFLIMGPVGLIMKEGSDTSVISYCKKS